MQQFNHGGESDEQTITRIREMGTLCNMWNNLYLVSIQRYKMSTLRCEYLLMRILTLAGGKYVAIISAVDLRRCNKYSWYVHMSKGTKRKAGAPYARATINGKKVYLHRFVMNAPEFMHVDHKNHQTLDCRRENLEVVCHKENQKRRRKKNGK